jgi:hypothetical protein
MKGIRTLIQANYPRYIKGLLSLEVERAIIRYVATEKKVSSSIVDIGTHTQIIESDKYIVKRENNH